MAELAKTWIADVFEKSNNGSPPERHRFNLGKFVFLHEAESALRKEINGMNYEFDLAFVCFSFDLGYTWSHIVSDLGK